MNKARRKLIAELQARLIDLRDAVQSVLDEEQEYLDNMPEGLAQGQKGQDAEEAIDTISEILNSIDEASDLMLGFA
jgi:hypothetical protein